MSLDLNIVRDQLAYLIGSAVDGLRVYPRGVDGTFTPPAAVLGQPWVEFDVQPCDVHRYTLGVAVVVGRDGLDEVATQRQLEERWVAVADYLRGVVDQVSGVASASVLRSEFGQFSLQGQQFPCQIITLEFYG